MSCPASAGNSRPEFLNILVTEAAFRQFNSDTDPFQLPSRKGPLKKENFLIYSNLMIS
jgi:hypothetical protein